MGASVYAVKSGAAKSRAVLCGLAALLAGCSGGADAPSNGPSNGGESQAGAQTGVEADIVFVGGSVIDGTNAPAFEGDVAVAGDRIVYVGPKFEGRAARAVEAAGHVVAPGFIDAHSHTDRALAEPGKGGNEGVVRQGVTTIVGGPDGGAEPEKIRGYMSAYEENGVATNYAFYVGHNGIRRAVMGDAAREATPEEIESMRALVREGMEMGAVGFSTGLMYEPGMWSTTDEVAALAAEAEPFGGIYDSHVRSPVFDLIESDAEAIEIGRRAGIAVKIGHEKVVGLDNAGKLDEVIALVEDARAEGMNVVTDQYPYDGAATRYLHDIFVLPADLEEAAREAAAGAQGGEARQARFDFVKAQLADADAREKIRQLSTEGRDGGFSWIKAVGYSSIRIVDAPSRPSLVGVHISQLAEREGTDGFDAMVALMAELSEPAKTTLGSVASEDVSRLMAQPWNMIASDGAWLEETDTPGGGHPRSTGTFARVLGHYVREEGVLELHEAIWKMTGFPAEFLSLSDRGRLAEGLAADVVVFDPDTVADRSTWENPTLYATGVRDVMVNGVFVMENGETTDARPGRFVPRGGGEERGAP